MNQPAQKRAILAAAKWTPDFVDRSPMFAPVAPYARVFSSLGAWPDLAMMQTLLDASRVCNRRGVPIRVVSPRPGGDPYEQCIYERGELQVREGDWHDLFNVLVWLAYPLSKAALNEKHVMSAARPSGRSSVHRAGWRSERGRVRDALTLFDESGAVVVSSDQLLMEELRSFRWKTLFWEHRSHVAVAMRFFVFGHAVFEKALAPYVGMTAHATTFVVPEDFMADSPDRQLVRCDALLAERISAPDEFVTPLMLAPVPLLGVPGWSEASGRAAFYDNERYFRRGRRSGSA